MKSQHSNEHRAFSIGHCECKGRFCPSEVIFRPLAVAADELRILHALVLDEAKPLVRQKVCDNYEFQPPFGFHQFFERHIDFVREI